MANEVEKQTLNFFAMGIRELVNGIRENERDPKGKGGGANIIIALFFFSVAFLFCGAEAMKVVFRRNFAKETVGIAQIVVAGLAFMAWGAWCLFPSSLGSINFIEESNYFSASQLSFRVAGCFYVILSLVVLVKGLNDWHLSNNFEGGTLLGESTILKFLQNSGWSEFKIRQIGEPLCLIAVSVLLAGFSLFFALPLLFCALSMIIFNIITYKKVVESAPLTARFGGKYEDNSGENTAR